MNDDTPAPQGTTVARDPRMGWVCEGLGIEGHGMTRGAAIASWSLRWSHRQLRCDERRDAELYAGVARPFDYTPL